MRNRLCPQIPPCTRLSLAAAKLLARGRQMPWHSRVGHETSERGFAGKVQASIVPSATTTASPAIAADVSSPCLIEIESSIRLGRRCRRGGFGRTKKPQVGGRVRTKNEPDASGAGRNLSEHLQPLATDRILEISESSEVASGARKARNEATPDRIADKREYDRNGAGFLLQDRRYLVGARHDHVRCGAD